MVQGFEVRIRVWVLEIRFRIEGWFLKRLVSM